MSLIYGNVPRELPGAYRYGQSALVDETVAAGSSTTPSYFEISRSLKDTHNVSVTLIAPAGDYSCVVEGSVDDGENFVPLRTMTQADPAQALIEYVNSQLKLRVKVTSAIGPVRCILRQE